MNDRILYRDADLEKKPSRIQNDSFERHVSVGDLHGNALKLIYVLIEEGFINPTDEQYKTLHDIYYTPVNRINAEMLQTFESIIDSLNIDTTRALTLLGDELADRGENDYFTLLILKKLHQSNLDVNIILSNHSMEFIRDYENKTFTGRSALRDDQGYSLRAMRYLISKKLISDQKIRDLVEQDYIPLVNAIGYTQSEDGITIYTHAPNGLETIKALADKCDVHYNDETISELIDTIDKVNEKLLSLFKDKRLAHEMDCEYSPRGSSHIPLFSPIRRLVWNRELDDELITKPKGKKYTIKFVHGHIGQYDLKRSSHQNLDSNFGKCDNTHTSKKVFHRTRQANEFTLKQINKHFSEMIKRFELLFNAELELFKQQIDANRNIPNSNKANLVMQELYVQLKQAGKSFFNVSENKLLPIHFKNHCERLIINATKKIQTTRVLQSFNHIIKGFLGVLSALTVVPALTISALTKKGYAGTFFKKSEKMHFTKTQQDKLKEKLTSLRNHYDNEANNPSISIENIS